MPLLRNHKGPQRAGNTLEITSFAFGGVRAYVAALPKLRDVYRVTYVFHVRLVTHFFSGLASVSLDRNVLTCVCARFILGSR